MGQEAFARPLKRHGLELEDDEREIHVAQQGRRRAAGLQGVQGPAWIRLRVSRTASRHPVHTTMMS